MKVKELDRRVMLELIEHKYQELKSNKIKIDENDFRENKSRNECYSPYEIVDILLALEKLTNGKIKLLSITPKNDKPKEHTQDEWKTMDYSVGAKAEYPNYFYINYDPYILENRDSDKDRISITKKEGICRVIKGEPKCYMPEGRRKEILFILEKDFIETKKLSKKIGITDRLFMSEIKDIRKLIEDTIHKNGKDVIENKKGAGYRINPSIKINY